MAVTEHQRPQLFTWSQDHMEQERAATMMELLPPAGSDQLATKADLQVGINSLRAELKSAIADLQRTFGTWLFASQAAVIAVVALVGVAT